jgi:non-heme chloroperoxidase
MASIRVPGSGEAFAELRYDDEGAGAPVVLVRSASLPRAAWKRLSRLFLEEGHRVVSYDRQTPPHAGRADNAAANVNVLLTSLDLHHAVIVAHAAGADDVLHYLLRFGAERVMRAVLLAPLPAFRARAVEVPMLIIPEIDGAFAKSADALAALLRFIHD